MYELLPQTVHQKRQIGLSLSGRLVRSDLHEQFGFGKFCMISWLSEIDGISIPSRQRLARAKTNFSIHTVPIWTCLLQIRKVISYTSYVNIFWVHINYTSINHFYPLLLLPQQFCSEYINIWRHVWVGMARTSAFFQLFIRSEFVL